MVEWMEARRTATMGSGNMGTGFSYLTNRPTTRSADANGNSTASGYAWDMETRLLKAAANTWYAYDPHGKRVLTEVTGSSPSGELDFYSIGGKTRWRYFRGKNTTHERDIQCADVGGTL